MSTSAAAVPDSAARSGARSGADRDAQPVSHGHLNESASAPVTIERLWPGEGAAVFVRHYWTPRWRLVPGASLRQQVLEYPTANVVFEQDTTALHLARRGLSVKTLRGDGWAFGAMLRPGVARGLAGVSVRSLPSAVPLADGAGVADGVGVADAAGGYQHHALLLPGVDALKGRIHDAMRRGDDRAAVEAFEEWTATLPAPGAEARMVDAIVAAVETDRTITRVEQLADRFGLGVRHLQRLVAGHIGFGPKWLIQRYRLQEAAAALRSPAPPQLAELAAELGYSDQAHFGREFKAVIGSTPGTYLAETTRGRDGARPLTESV
ncbi:helix-turn-helix domain-containing protein [Leifsonia sp. NPDC102414]|uniref:helix-turn-helix domain-containing protein n=1 Tax=Leifsonia sp. NPDC102414 TaxID=3364124 RepID=UPI00380E5D0D